MPGFALAAPVEWVASVTTDVRWERESAAGTHALRARRPDEAERHFCRALRLAETFGEADPRLATTLQHLAHLFDRERKRPELERVARRLLALQERTIGPTHVDLVGSLGRLANACTMACKHDEAVTHYRRALAIAERHHGLAAPEVVPSLHALAVQLMGARESAEAGEHFGRARTILETAQPVAPPVGLAAILDCQAMNHTFAGRHADVEDVLRARIALAERSRADTLTLGSLFAKWAEACHERGKDHESDVLYRRALAHYERWFRSAARAKRFRGPKRAGTRVIFRAGLASFRARLLHEHAAVLRALGSDDEAARNEDRAERNLRRALTHEEARPDGDGIHLLSDLQMLAAICRARGKRDEAERLDARVVVIEAGLERDNRRDRRRSGAAMRRLEGVKLHEGPVTR